MHLASTPNCQRLWLAGPTAPKHIGPRRLGRTRGKMHLRRWPDDGRSGSGPVAPAPNQLGRWAIRRPVANQRLRGSERLGAFFDLTLRAGRIAPRPDGSDAVGPANHRPPQAPKVPGAGTQYCAARAELSWKLGVGSCLESADFSVHSARAHHFARRRPHTGPRHEPEALPDTLEPSHPRHRCELPPQPVRVRCVHVWQTARPRHG